MVPAILSLGTAVPAHVYSQEALAEAVSASLQMDSRLTHWYRKVSENSAIRNRYSVVPDFSSSGLSETSFQARNQIFLREAPGLAHEAAKLAIENWGGDPQKITHIVSATCTGVICPGIEVHLMRSLSLSPSVERLGVNFMGCFGGFKALAAAKALAQENPKNRVLIICTELCSLHLHPTTCRETLIGNVLFADGASAAVIGQSGGEQPLWEIHATGSHIFPDTENEMTWEAGDASLVMRLTKEVPIKIREGIRSFLQNLSGEVSFDQCDWALHPGGKAILQNIEQSLGLIREQTVHSWDVLAEYGNMSSATFLFVLDRLRKAVSSKEWTLGAGFGPGLAMEGVLLRRPA